MVRAQPTVATAATSGRLGLADLDEDRTAHELRVVELADGVIGIARVLERHEAEAAARAGLTVGGHTGLGDLAELDEEVLDVLLRGIEIEAPDEELAARLGRAA
eukprot:CAMPEP_0119526334 /NCGR_PEP_ID=MMETSP1344-20130328/40972_1 /TAXON_ID=236787 /ORGANISM="Florenciella parvula, Strain CCMP2471" /LENGTH=103 /DNA_ID=CAMNT_0007565303 /DNA_START=58 /DNA_END=366 /DNA_ORIENTATION=+